jgi:biotin-(acetyl-CoA carboxylase) ligase
MSLYYEPDPANDDDEPLLPPILTPVVVPNNVDVFTKAIASASNSEAGTVYYSENPEYLEVAVVLIPEVPKVKCNQMLYVMMVAASDAIGALAPPEVAVTFSYPGLIFLNRGEAGLVKIEVSPSIEDKTVPDWMVVGIKLRLNNNLQVDESNIKPDITSLADEGAGFISRTRAIESLARHFLAWVSQWEDDGFKAVVDVWNKRREETIEITLKGNQNVSWVGLDENGLAIVKLKEKELFLSPVEITKEIGEINLQ